MKIYYDMDEVKWKTGMLIFFIVIVSMLLFGCEKQCLNYSCETVNDKGETERVTVNGANSLVYGQSTRCVCIDEVNRYTR